MLLCYFTAFIVSDHKSLITPITVALRVPFSFPFLFFQQLYYDVSVICLCLSCSGLVELLEPAVYIFHQIWKNTGHYFFKCFSSAFFALFYLSGMTITCKLGLLIMSHKFLRISSLFFPSFLFLFSDWILSIEVASFFNHFQHAVNSIQWI